MAIMYNNQSFGWRGRSSARGPRRVVVWVEELESRQVLATVVGTGNPLLLVQMPKAGATTPALVAQVSTTKPVTTPSSTPTNLINGTGKVAPFTAVNGQPPTSPTTSPATSATLPQSPGIGTPINPAPPTNPGIPLPPILQGATVVPPTGPLTYADLQTITTNFIGGGHHEPPPSALGRSYNPPNTPRPLPSSMPAQQSARALDSAPAVTAELSPFLATEALVPMLGGFAEEPPLIGDQTEEVLQSTDGSIGLRAEVSAAPVIAAALAAHWADRQRRPDEEEESAKAGI